MRGLESISFDQLFTYCDYQQDLMVINFTRIIVTLMSESSYTFSQRIINDWNNLPRDIIESPDVASFKSQLDVYWQELCCKFLE